MITYVVSDLFLSPAKVLVNTVNTVGAMGKGLAYQFRQLYPEMYEQYQLICTRDQLRIGQLWLYSTPHKWVLNFPTKKDWRDPSRLEYIEHGLHKFVQTYAQKGITSVSFPTLGTGLGGLDWETMVRPLMERTLGQLPIDVYIHLYEPDNRFALNTPLALQRQWLHGIPQTPTFTHFRDDLAAVLKQRAQFETLDEGIPFNAAFDDFEERIILRGTSNEPITTLSESTLADVWHFIHSAGYCLPQNFPSGLDNHASYVVALLAQVKYIHPVYLSRMQGQRRVGLHYIPPVTEELQTVSLQ